LLVADDAILVQRCLAGDESGRRDLVDQFQQAVFGLCFRMLGHRHDAEDVSQETFLRAFRSLNRWDAERPLKPWLLTIAANRCRTFIERRAKTPAATEFATTAPVGCLDGAEQRELGEELQRALGRLRDDYRTCFVLFYLRELSCAEIAEQMKCPQGTVKTWLHRARRELAEHLQRRGIVPDVHSQLQ
jgi:RNA polymerase sigma-70 factor, ECF subfamily